MLLAVSLHGELVPLKGYLPFFPAIYSKNFISVQYQNLSRVNNILVDLDVSLGSNPYAEKTCFETAKNIYLLLNNLYQSTCETPDKTSCLL